MARIVGPDTDITREVPRVAVTATTATRADAAVTDSVGHAVTPPGAVVTEDATAPGGILIDPSGAWPAPDVSTQMARPLVVSRQCSRPGCAEPAAVTLTYNYDRQQVWIDALLPERNPHSYDLCDRHADRLSVPNGWHLDDRRHVSDGRLTSLIAV